MDDFLFFADNKDAALQLRDRVACLLDRLGLGRATPRKAIGSRRKSASTSASKSTPQPLPSEPLLRNYMPSLPSPGHSYNALRATHGGYLSGSSQCSPEKYNTCTSQFQQRDSTSANYTTSSLRARDGRAGCNSPTSCDETSNGGRKSPPPTTAAPYSPPSRPPTCTAIAQVTVGELY
jgi:hypothetical protein